MYCMYNYSNRLFTTARKCSELPSGSCPGTEGIKSDDIIKVPVNNEPCEGEGKHRASNNFKTEKGSAHTFYAFINHPNAMLGDMIGFRVWQRKVVPTMMGIPQIKESLISDSYLFNGDKIKLPANTDMFVGDVTGTMGDTSPFTICFIRSHVIDEG